MMKKYLGIFLFAALSLNTAVEAQNKPATPAANDKPASQAAELTKSGVASGTAKADPILMTNQMMLVFMERMKSGNLNEAREVANEMIFGHEKYLDSDLKEHKSFHSAMEKELYGIIAKRAGSSKKVEWVEQPVSDGFYFLAILDFQEGRHEDALANLGKAIFWNPVRSAFYNERGFMLLKKNSGPDLTMAQVAYMKALELADNNEDLAAALRGLAFVLVERNLLDQALACLLVSKTYDSSNDDADEEIMFIRRQAPALVTGMDLAKAGELLRANAIPAGFAADHVQVLINLADDYTAAKDNQKAAALLKKAMEMAPENQEVARRLKAAGK